MKTVVMLATWRSIPREFPASLGSSYSEHSLRTGRTLEG
jgi:hypothetical protein